MTKPRAAAVALATCAAGLLSACGPQHIQTPERDTRPAHDQVVLLPDPNSGALGRATVSTTAGSVDLATARAATLLSANQPPSPPTELSEAEVARLFGQVLSTLPPDPLHFTFLDFKFQSDELTEESRTLVTRILPAMKDRPAPDVIVVGHTDTTGAPAVNAALGLKRANMVRTLLIAAGIDGSVIDATSHGEADLLIRTADAVAEPRNRRVEVTVR